MSLDMLVRLGGTRKIPIPGHLQILEFLDVTCKSFHLKLSKILSKHVDSLMIWEFILTKRSSLFRNCIE